MSTMKVLSTWTLTMATMILDSSGKLWTVTSGFADARIKASSVMIVEDGTGFG